MREKRKGRDRDTRLLATWTGGQWVRSMGGRRLFSRQVPVIVGCHCDAAAQGGAPSGKGVLTADMLALHLRGQGCFCDSSRACREGERVTQHIMACCIVGSGSRCTPGRVVEAACDQIWPCLGSCRPSGLATQAVSRSASSSFFWRGGGGAWSPIRRCVSARPPVGARQWHTDVALSQACCAQGCVCPELKRDRRVSPGPQLCSNKLRAI